MYQQSGVNARYFVLPVILGVLPGTLFGLLFLGANAGVPACAQVLLLVTAGIMLYAVPPAFVTLLCGGRISFDATSGAMLTYPNSAGSWVIIVVFYFLLGLGLNRCFKITYRHPPVLLRNPR